MLDRLPPELVDHVLDLLPQPPAAERADTLRACCLVSKRLRDIALPTLWRHVELNGDEQERAFVERVEDATTEHLLGEITSMTLFGHSGIVEPLLERFPALGKLTWDVSVGGLDLSSWGGWACYLMTLSLSDAYLSTLTPFTFPSLTSLSLSRVQLPLSLMPTIWSSTTFPSLRALSYSPPFAVTPVLPLFLSYISPPFSDQLDLVQIPYEDGEHFAAGYGLALPSAVPTLITLSSSFLETDPDAQEASVTTLADSEARHLRLVLDEDESVEQTTNLLQASEQVFRRSSSCQSFVLPTSVRRVGVSPSLSCFLEACATRSVDVIWANGELEDEHEVSPAFWRYVREIKAKQVA
ncbi:hypothetical protein JCM8547_002735 [Rhodosporidiobolus lusitaniae]